VLRSLDPGQGIGQKECLSPFCCTVDCGLRPLWGRELGKFSSRPAQYTCICEPDTPYLMTVSSTCVKRLAGVLAARIAADSQDAGTAGCIRKKIIVYRYALVLEPAWRKILTGSHVEGLHMPSILNSKK